MDLLDLPAAGARAGEHRVDRGDEGVRALAALAGGLARRDPGGEARDALDGAQAVELVRDRGEGVRHGARRALERRCIGLRRRRGRGAGPAEEALLGVDRLGQGAGQCRVVGGLQRTTRRRASRAAAAVSVVAVAIVALGVAGFSPVKRSESV